MKEVNVQNMKAGKKALYVKPLSFHHRQMVAAAIGTVLSMHIFLHHLYTSSRSLAFLLSIAFLFTCYPAAVELASGAQSHLASTQRPYIVNHKKYYPIQTTKGFKQTGIASWYGSDFHGKKTSNGEIYNMHGDTAAHKILPMNTVVLVRNLENNRELAVRINDRGPFVYGRIIDLSYSAAKRLGLLKNGTAKVEITALGEMKRNPKGEQVIRIGDLTHGEYYVQIGAFVNEDNAKRLLKRFTDTGHPTVIQKYYTKEAVFYRVQVYVGNELGAAQEREKALLNLGYTGAFLIAR